MDLFLHKRHGEELESSSLCFYLQGCCSETNSETGAPFPVGLRVHSIEFTAVCGNVYQVSLEKGQFLDASVSSR